MLYVLVVSYSFDDTFQCSGPILIHNNFIIIIAGICKNTSFRQSFHMQKLILSGSLCRGNRCIEKSKDASKVTQAVSFRAEFQLSDEFMSVFLWPTASPMYAW